MTEELIISSGDRQQRYLSLIPQLDALIGSETDWLANLSNVSAALKQTFGFLWIGFYRVQGQELLLGPFQGPVACTRIKKGQGVCGVAWRDAVTVMVPNVDEFPGHIACSSDSKSEIVVPIFNSSGDVVFVLDVDSARLDDFGLIDQQSLEKIASIIGHSLIHSSFASEHQGEIR